jgi:hypothetical protein
VRNAAPRGGFRVPLAIGGKRQGTPNDLTEAMNMPLKKMQQGGNAPAKIAIM